MDFTWVNEGQNPRKHPNIIQKSANTSSSSLSHMRLQNDIDNSNTQSSSRVTFQTMSSPLRRPRADTMPSQSSAFPYAPDGFSNLPAPNIVNPPLHQSNDNLNNMHNFSIATRHRSGSLTLPSGGYDNNSLSQTPFTPSMYNSYDPSSPIDENASNTIASTLASLGLDDETTAPYTENTHHTTMRGRSFTVSGQIGSDLQTPNPSRLAFNPFSPQTQSSVLTRPRAISLGMADSFSPFNTNQLKNSASSLNSTPLTSTPTSLLPPSRLRMQPVQNESPLRTSHSTANIADINDDLMYNMDDGHEYFGQPDDADSPTFGHAQVPSRALWLGNINPSVSVPDLVKLFSSYGQVESARILSDKECAFVNFITMESAVAAKNDLETRLGSMIGGTPVRVGYGKADVTLAMALTNDAGPNAQGPTRALWVGNIPANMDSSILRSIFQAFGPIESVRVLSNKNCGFINFDHQEDAVRARKAMQNKEILGPGSGAVRIGFAKVLPNIPDDAEEIPGTSEQVTPPNQANLNVAPMKLPNAAPSTDNFQAAQWATAVMMNNMLNSGQTPANQPTLYKAIASERKHIMQQLGCDPSEKLKVEERVPLIYFSVIPPVTELGPDRKLEPLHLRDMRKRLEKEDQISVEEVDAFAAECMEEIVELCSDYIGNTVIQKLFEHGSDESKLAMLHKIAPYLASIGVHKNGTWAAQKIIDYSNTPEQIQLISQHIAPYVPLLLLDQFGNYVVQCCLRKGSDRNQYIFDAIVDKCWEIGQGRFGARSVRSILENSIVSKEQQVYVAATIVQNTVLLTTNANGILLLNWLLDTSDLPQRYQVLAPRLLPYLSKLSSHKLGSTTVYKVIQQTQDPEASTLLLGGLSEKSKAELLNNNKK